MLITRTSMVSGKTRTIDLPITQEQYDRWKNGELIQRAMPNLNPGQREFILTGITGEEWDEVFQDQGEEEATCDGCGDCTCGDGI